MSLWSLRWRAAHLLISAAIWVAPKSAARDILLEHLNAAGDVILHRIAERKEREATTAGKE